MKSPLVEAIQAKNHEIQTFLFAYFAQKITQLHPDHIVAILVYGSYLNEVTKSATSTPDFYVIVDDYRKFYEKSRDRFLNSHLPPNIYHINTPQGACKYCVISIRHLEKEVGRKIKDVYHIGRFSKRMGMVWAIDQLTDDEVAKIQATATLSVCKKILQAAEGPFTLGQFIEKSIYLSYLGDVRIESPDKVLKIMTSEQSYYEKVFALALQELNVPQNALGQYVIQKSPIQKKIDHFLFEKFIHQSRARARMRWPKNMFTVKNWLDYMIAKIERTQAIKIELSPTERKFWYIFGWKHFYRLYRKKLIK